MILSLILCMFTQISIVVAISDANFIPRTNVEIKFSKNNNNVIDSEKGLTVGLQLGEVCSFFFFFFVLLFQRFFVNRMCVPEHRY